MACILEELEKTLTKQLGNTKNSKEFKEGATKAKERVAELSTLLNEVGAMKKVMQGQVNTETNAQTKVKVLEDMLNKSEQSKLRTMVDTIIADKNIDRVHNKTGQTGIAFGPIEYSYSNGRYSHKQKDMPKEILELANQIGETLGRTKDYYNHVLINKFEDGIGIGMHPDNEPIYKDTNGAIGAVAIYSIGSTKVPHIIENEKYTAKNNSLVEMASGSMYHSVGAADGVRYSFTFRHIPENNLPKEHSKTDTFLTNTELNSESNKVASINNNSQESKMRQLLTIYKDQDAPKIGGGLVEDVTRKSVYDEDIKAATMMKGTQDSTLKDMLPKVDGRTINSYEKAVNAWYKDMKRGTAVKNKLAELIELIKTIEYSPELMEELGWSKENETVPINSKGFNGYISIKDIGGKGSVEGDAKDIAMREVADGFVGEISNGRLNNSSTGTSYNALKDNVSGPTSAGSITYHGAAEPSTVMLARNGSFRGKPLNSETKEAIEYYFQEGASFVVGDMPGVDSQFIDYLDEIGASYKIYHTGSSPRIVKNDIQYQKVSKDNYKQEADIIVPTETFQKNVNRKIECKE